MNLSRRKFLKTTTAAALAAPAVSFTASAESAATSESTSKENTTMKITRNGSQPSSKGSPEYFTGSVRVDMLFTPEAPARTSAAQVTFEPGTRTAWHTHPLGQTLVVTSGLGWVQSEELGSGSIFLQDAGWWRSWVFSDNTRKLKTDDGWSYSIILWIGCAAESCYRAPHENPCRHWRWPGGAACGGSGCRSRCERRRL